MVAYSYGCVVALELVAILDREGYIGKLILLDGAPDMLIGLTKLTLNADEPADFETNILMALLALYMPAQQLIKYRDEIYNCGTYEERMTLALSSVPKQSPHSPAYQREVALGMYKRLNALINYKPTFERLRSSVKLYRPEGATVQNIEEDYNLSKLTEKPVEVKFFKGNHLTILENVELAREIMEAASEERIDEGKVGRFESSLERQRNEEVTTQEVY